MYTNVENEGLVFKEYFIRIILSLYRLQKNLKMVSMPSFNSVLFTVPFSYDFQDQCYLGKRKIKTLPYQLNLMKQTSGVTLLRFLTVLNNFQTLLTFGELTKMLKIKGGFMRFLFQVQKEKGFSFGLVFSIDCFSSSIMFQKVLCSAFM